MKLLACLPMLLISMPMPASAQIQGAPIFVSGVCDPKSGVTIDGRTSRFWCDSAVVVRTQRGTVLIHFADKKGDDGRILGFAGTIEGRQGFGAAPLQVMAVERIYLAGGAEPIPADRGTCMMTWSGLHRKGGRLESIVCGGRGSAAGSDVQAMAVIQARANPRRR